MNRGDLPAGGILIIGGMDVIFECRCEERGCKSAGRPENWSAMGKTMLDKNRKAML